MPESLNDAESELVDELCEAIRFIGGKGWAPGTGGNFSAIESRDPLRILLTPSGVDKPAMTPDQMLRVDSGGQVLSGGGQPSAETPIHLSIIRVTGAACVLHTHSIWNTLISLQSGGRVEISGLEMLKGLAGVTTHEHREIIPVIPNSQDMPALSEAIEAVLRDQPGIHGFLLQGHGLYTWGSSISEAKRHVEIFEFLFEVTGRRSLPGG